MSRTRIKFCGICRPQDAAKAARAGADAIGMVFDAQSARFVTIEQARDITKVIPPFVSTGGLFVDADLQTIQNAAAQLALSAIQLQGNESPELVAKLAPLPIIKAIKVNENFEQTLIRWKNAITELHLTNLIGLLLESAGPLPGGSGVPNDWNAITRLQAAGKFAGLPPLIAAGGLTPQTVANVVRLLHPFAVDVSSGIEDSRRDKSATKMNDFVQAVRAADGNRQ